MNNLPDPDKVVFKHSLYKFKTENDIGTIIIQKVNGAKIVKKIKSMIADKNFPEKDAQELLEVIESEIISLHEGNVARFKVRPSEFQEWKKLQA
jgi:predicted XRE-type DNA-binding protein